MITARIQKSSVVKENYTLITSCGKDSFNRNDVYIVFHFSNIDSHTPRQTHTKKYIRRYLSISCQGKFYIIICRKCKKSQSKHLSLPLTTQQAITCSK